MKKLENHQWGEHVIIYEGAQIHPSVTIGPFSIIYPNVVIENDVTIASSVIVGKSPSVGKNQTEVLESKNCTTIKKGGFIGDQTIIYSGVEIGFDCYLADRSFIRENVTLAANVVIGTMCVISFNARIGEGSKVMTGSNICGNMTIGKNCFIGAHVCTVTDNNPKEMSIRKSQKGPVLEDNVFIGSNSTILPGVVIIKNITLGAGSVASKNLNEEGGVYMGIPTKLIKIKY